MNNIIYVGYPTDDESKLHSHKGYEIKLCSSGGRVETADDGCFINDGDFLVVPLLLKHSYTGGENLTVILDQALLPIKQITIIPSDKAYGLMETFNQANFYFNNNQPDCNNILSALGDLIAAYITAYSGNKKFSPIVNTVMAEIDKNLNTTSFSLDGFMHTLPLNYDYVRKLFKKEVGITPHEYLTNSRMELAKNIIISGISNQYSSYTISQIAEMCGFAEPLYFSRVFKKYFGISPSEFNKQG